MTDPSRPVTSSCLALAMFGMLSACATPQEQVASREDKLIAAGFIARPANTPERDAMLQRLRPNHFFARQVGNGYVYLYPDPLVCGCLYVGSAQAYGRYKQQMLQQRLVDEQQTTAELYSDPAWNFGPWGGPFGPGFGSSFGVGFY